MRVKAFKLSSCLDVSLHAKSSHGKASNRASSWRRSRVIIEKAVERDVQSHGESKLKWHWNRRHDNKSQEDNFASLSSSLSHVLWVNRCWAVPTSPARQFSRLCYLCFWPFAEFIFCAKTFPPLTGGKSSRCLLIFHQHIKRWKGNAAESLAMIHDIFTHTSREAQPRSFCRTRNHISSPGIVD